MNVHCKRWRKTFLVWFPQDYDQAVERYKAMTHC
jgi:hypothetical protein